MLLRVTVGLVEFDGSVGVSQPFEGPREVVTRLRFPERQLLFIENPFGNPLLGSVLSAVIVLNQTDPIGCRSLPQTHHHLSLLELAVVRFRVDPKFATNSVGLL